MIDVEKARRLLASGMTQRQVADRLGVSTSGLNYAIYKEGCGTPRTVWGPIPTFSHVKAAELYRGGMTVREVGEALGVSPSRASRAIKLQGVEMRQQTTKPAPRSFSYEEAAALYESGGAITDIAARFGVGTTAISRALKIQGVEIRKQGRRSYSAMEAGGGINLLEGLPDDVQETARSLHRLARISWEEAIRDARIIIRREARKQEQAA